jgi:steroid 5-alpha reductase family enzyme
MAPSARWNGFFRVFVVYLAAAVTAVLTFAATPEMPPVLRLLLADVVATFVVYSASVGAANTSFYDAYWSVAPPLLLVLGWALPEAVGADTLRQSILLFALTMWGIRLTWNWARGWSGPDHEDWRYVAYRERFPAPVFELVNLFGLHFFPTLIVFLAMTGGVFAWTSPAPAGVLAWLGGAVVLGGTALEFVADNELRAFRRAHGGTGRILDTGVWSWSRHPNYFGEVCVWWGVWLVGVDASAPLWTVLGPLAITGLFVVVSIPLLDRRMAESRAGWAEHVAKTRALLPLPRRR